MTAQTQLAKKQQSEMSVMDAIYKRRSVRSYKPRIVELDDIHVLLSAAVQAPNAMNQEPWVFSIIQDREMLNELSEDAKRSLNRDIRRYLPYIEKGPDFNVFYNAGTLVVIYGERDKSFAAVDCWLAAENFMLAACSMGLGSCVIGLAAASLNKKEWKERLGISEDMQAVAPIVLGWPGGEELAVSRKDPEIVSWWK